MNKEDFLSKLNIKDYNNQLEKILEEKSFSEGSKNILLNILYKIEIAYDDYSKVKVEVKQKNELLEDIIDTIKNGCNEIQLVKIDKNKNSKLECKKFIVEKESKKIISFPSEKNVFYALCNLSNKELLINSKYSIIKEPMEKLLNQGYITDIEEIIRDFDGWSWNIVSNEIENYVYNIVFQLIKILVGYKFLQENIDNIANTDFINRFESKINEIYGEELKNTLTKDIYQISIIENIKEDKEKQKNIEEIQKKLKQNLEKMENKKEYLQKIANVKKVIGKKIKQIDEIINDNKLLREKFIERNKHIEEEKKIFSLSEYSDILQNKRDILLLRLKEYSELMKPINYVKRKTELQNKIDILKGIKLEENLDQVENNLFIELQLNFLKAYAKLIKNVKTKKEIIQYIYLFRYYKVLQLNEKEKIKDVKELQEEIIKTEKYLITKACNLKAINILCKSVDKNYEIISEILSYNIIDLEDLVLEFRKKEDNIILNIYEEQTIEQTREYENIEDINVKLNKKIKLFN